MSVPLPILKRKYKNLIGKGFPAIPEDAISVLNEYLYRFDIKRLRLEYNKTAITDSLPDDVSAADVIKRIIETPTPLSLEDDACFSRLVSKYICMKQITPYKHVTDCPDCQPIWSLYEKYQTQTNAYISKVVQNSWHLKRDATARVTYLLGKLVKTPYKLVSFGDYVDESRLEMYYSYRISPTFAKNITELLKLKVSDDDIREANALDVILGSNSKSLYIPSVCDDTQVAGTVGALGEWKEKYLLSVSCPMTMQKWLQKDYALRKTAVYKPKEIPYLTLQLNFSELDTIKVTDRRHGEETIVLDHDNIKKVFQRGVVIGCMVKSNIHGKYYNIIPTEIYIYNTLSGPSDHRCLSDPAMLQRFVRTSVYYTHPLVPMIEHKLHNFIKKRTANVSKLPLFDHLVESVSDQKVQLELERFDSGEKTTTTQRNALCKLCYVPFAKLTGKPGTGKTHVLQLACKILISWGKRLLILTPTGTALANIKHRFEQTMDSEDAEGPDADKHIICDDDRDSVHDSCDEMESTDDLEMDQKCSGKKDVKMPPTCTCAQITFMNIQRYVIRKQLCKRHPTVKPDVIICDESSMIDYCNWVKLFGIVTNDTRLILAGDGQQLPPIGAGALFKDMTAVMIPEACIISLVDIVRQTSGTLCEIISLMGDFKSIDKNPKFFDCCNFIQLLSMDLVTWDTNTLVLTPLNKNKHLLNIKLQARYNKTPNIAHEYGVDYKDNHGVRYESYFFRLGDPIMRDSPTDYENDQYRGVLYAITKYENKVVTIRRQYDGKELEMATKELYASYVPAWCLTVHKAQGGQKKKVTIYLPKEDVHMLDRAIIYTAVSRAEEECKIITDVTKENLVGYYEKETDILTGFSLSLHDE